MSHLIRNEFSQPPHASPHKIPSQMTDNTQLSKCKGFWAQSGKMCDHSHYNSNAKRNGHDTAACK